MIRRKVKDKKLKRTNRHTIMFNNRELGVLKAYCAKYKIINRSKFMREAIITTVLKKLDDDYPTLWDDGEHNLFSKYQ
ncbi:MAG: hypothetical protein IMY71_10680 [Bacteroidetes bacterium]|nr:hypothetical protein [Bacteroidota bacterium]